MNRYYSAHERDGILKKYGVDSVLRVDLTSFGLREDRTPPSQSTRTEITRDGTSSGTDFMWGFGRLDNSFDSLVASAERSQNNVISRVTGRCHAGRQMKP